jgi:hypothetical protein
VPARLTAATAQAACVEIDVAARAGLAAAVAARTAGATARPCPRRARLGDLDVEAGPRLADAPAAPPVERQGAGAFAVERDAAAFAVATDADELDAAAAHSETNAAEDDDASAQKNDATAPRKAAGAAGVAAEDLRGQIPLERRLALMSAAEKVQLALHGNREVRQLLLRDRAGVVQSSLVRNPKLSVDEAQALARAPQLAPEAAEVLAQHPSWGAAHQVALALVRNPRTPLPTATQLLSRLLPADLRLVAKGVGVRTPVSAAARKRLLDDER